MYIYSNDERAQIISLREQGCSYSYIATTVGCSVSTAQRIAGGPDIQASISRSQQAWRANHTDKVKEYNANQRSKTAHGCMLYVALSPDQPGMVKIGISENLSRRLVTLRTGAPHMEFVYTAPCDRHRETKLHAILKDRRIKDTTAREWFFFETEEEAVRVVRTLLKELQ